MRPTPTTPAVRLASRAGILLVTVVLLAACGDDAGPTTDPATTAAATSAAATTDDATTEGGETVAATPTSTATEQATEESTDDGAASGAATVAVASTDLGDVLVDGEGMTLYVFDNDDVDTSACTEGCLATWPPLLADDVTAGDGVTADLGTFTRDDGDVQVTANGMPLYLYAPDSAPGDVMGQGVGDVWWVVDPTGAKVTGAPSSAATTDEAGYGDPDY